MHLSYQIADFRLQLNPLPVGHSGLLLNDDQVDYGNIKKSH
jgi:hypothetical protein